MQRVRDMYQRERWGETTCSSHPAERDTEMKWKRTKRQRNGVTTGDKEQGCDFTLLQGHSWS